MLFRKIGGRMFSKRFGNSRKASRSPRGRAGRRSARCPLLGVERLEERQMLTSAPFGAMPMDTGEFMLGDVLVTVVLMESSENVSAVNPNSEDWRPETIAAAKDKVVEGILWWQDTLATQFPGNTSPLQFHFDFTHADTPIQTDVEPIANPSTFFASYVDPTTGMTQQGWIYDFLREVGHDATGNFNQDIRAFNHQQRLTHGTDWAFTVFVVNDENDDDGMFAPGGFSRAFAYSGGRFFISPAGRPPSTFAHETGHMFWALDEYPGVSSYFARRGYYNTQNLNAVRDNPTPTSVFVTIQPDSIMSKDYSRQELVSLTGGQWQHDEGRPVLTWAWERNTSAPSTLAMIGWQDTSGNGIFDVLDVPFSLTGSGYLDVRNEVYRFVGQSSVRTLPNRNSSGLQSDITLNRIHRAEYRVDDGPWQTAATFNAHRVNLDLRIDLPGAGEPSEQHVIQIRTVDDRTGVTSPIFTAHTGQLAAVEKTGINGFVWNDGDENGQFDFGERPIAGWTVRLVDEADQPLDWKGSVEPDAYAHNTRLEDVQPGVRLRALVHGTFQDVVAADSGTSSTGSRVFGYHLTPWSTVPNIDWDRNSEFRADFDSPVSRVELDAIVVSATGAARMEAYDADGNLLERVTTPRLSYGLAQTMRIERPTTDIDYILVKPHGDSPEHTHSITRVQLDHLRYGIKTQTSTNRYGSYQFSGLPEGTYRVQLVPPPLAPGIAQVHTVTLAGGETISGIDFAARAPYWQNPVDRHDVLDTGFVTPSDVLSVINFLNNNVNGWTVDPSQPSPPAFYDVNGDGVVSPADVLSVINRLNFPPTADDGSGVFDVTGGGGSSTGVGEGEGEAEVPAMASAGDVTWTSDHAVDLQTPREETPAWQALVPDVSEVPGHDAQAGRDEAVPANVPPQTRPDFVRLARDGYFRDLAAHPRLQRVDADDDLFGPRQAEQALADQGCDLFEQSLTPFWT